MDGFLEVVLRNGGWHVAPPKDGEIDCGRNGEVESHEGDLGLAQLHVPESVAWDGVSKTLVQLHFQHWPALVVAR